MVPVTTVCFKDETGRPLLALDKPCTGERIRFHHRDTGVNGRVSLGKSEWSGTPRARCINRSPMAFPATQLIIAETLFTPEG
jgi:hypothetical protein